MTKYLEFDTPATPQASDLKSDFGLANHGLIHLDRVFWNLPAPALYEEAVFRREAHVTHGGPLVVNTGKWSARAAQDKYVVREPSTEDKIWWGEYNRPYAPENFSSLLSRIQAFLQDEELFVQDCFVGADPDYRMPIRVITEFAWHSLFARTMFIPPKNQEEYQNHVPEFTVIAAPSFRVDPRIDGTRSETAIILNFAERLALICNSSYGGEIKKNAGASLVDIGDGVACLEFHSKMNAIGADIISMVHHAVKEVEANFEALVVGNQGSNFSVGANIMLLLLEAQEGNWEEIDLMVRQFQKGGMALRYCKKPVVAAPFGMALGGGCEIVLGAGHAYASAETYMGLVEMGVGLIPAGGGCKELLFRNVEGLPIVDGVDPFLAARAAFETIGLAKVSMSAADAKVYKTLRASDGITMNPDRVISGAKQMALGLARAGYRRPDRTHQVPVAGESGIASIRAQLYNMREGGYISEYDAYLGGELARVICGGALPAGTMVGEQYLLDLEREVFLRLCGQRKSLERIQHMLKKGKPLRN